MSMRLISTTAAVCRALLGLVFVAAALLKWFDPVGQSTYYGNLAHAAPAVGWAIIVGELLPGAWLISGIRAGPAAGVALFVLAMFSGAIVAVAAAPGDQPTSAVVTGRRFVLPRVPRTSLGLRISARPVRGKMEVVVWIRSVAPHRIRIVGPLYWSLLPVDRHRVSVGPRPQICNHKQLLAGAAPGAPFDLSAGASTPREKLRFSTRGLPASSPVYFIAQCCALVSTAPKGKARNLWVETEPVRLILRRKGSATQRAAAQKAPKPASVTAPVTYPRYVAPHGGPLRTLQELAKAVSAGNLRDVEALCLHGHHHPPPLYVAQAAAAISMEAACRAISRKFGAKVGAKCLRNLARTYPSAAVFHLWAAEVDAGTLATRGPQASVHVWEPVRGKLVESKSFAFRFARTHSKWLLDSRATMASLYTRARYRQQVAYNLRLAAVFDGIRAKILSGKITSLSQLLGEGDAELAAANHWEMRIAPSRPVRPRLPPSGVNESPGTVSPWGLEISGVSVTLAPARDELSLVASMRDRGPRSVVALGGPAFGWGIAGFDDHGRSLIYRSVDRFGAKAGVPTSRRHFLDKGEACAATFRLRRIFQLPKRGTFYFYATRFINVGRVGMPLYSPIVQLRLRGGRPPEWGTVDALPRVAKTRGRAGGPRQSGNP